MAMSRLQVLRAENLNGEGSCREGLSGMSNDADVRSELSQRWRLCCVGRRNAYGARALRHRR
jgi:hypothetical protein